MTVKVRLLAFTALAFSAAGGAAAAETLADAIAQAYHTNPSLQAARADQRALDEQYIQAKDALGPSAGITEQHSRAAANVKQSSFGFASTTFNRASTDNAALTISQPLYDGGALATAIDAAHADVLTGRQTLREQEQELLGQVITAYADVLLAQDLVIISEQDVEILRRQVAETQAKVEVKDVTLTDGAQANARLIASEVRLTQVRAQLANAQAKYRAIVGQSPGQLDPLPDLPGTPPTLSEALDTAGRDNPLLLQAVYTEQASRARIAEAKAADGLQIGLTASAESAPSAPYLDHQGINSVVGSVVISKPLFTAGLHSSRVRQAVETHERDDFKLADDQRQLISSVVQTWNALGSQRQVLDGLSRQLGEEDKAFKGSRIEARIGLRTTIDVLNAEQEYQATKVSIVQGFHDEYLTRVSLMANVWVLRAELLDPGIRVYHPEASLEQRGALNRVLAWESLVAALDGIGTPRAASETAGRGALTQPEAADAISMPVAPNWSDLNKYLAAESAKD